MVGNCVWSISSRWWRLEEQEKLFLVAIETHWEEIAWSAVFLFGMFYEYAQSTTQMVQTAVCGSPGSWWQFHVTPFLLRDVCWIRIAVFTGMQIFKFLLFFCKPFYLHDMKIDKEWWVIKKLC